MWYGLYFTEHLRRRRLIKADGGVDSAFSLEPHELKALVVESERAWQSLGEVTYGPTDAEQKSLVFRRSIYVSMDIEEGELFTTENLRIVRPGDGLPPFLYNEIIGKRATKTYTAGTALKMSDMF